MEGIGYRNDVEDEHCTCTATKSSKLDLPTKDSAAEARDLSLIINGWIVVSSPLR